MPTSSSSSSGFEKKRGPWLALNLAGEILGRDEANLTRLNGVAEGDDSEWRTWPHGTPLPVFVELRKLVRSQAFLEGETGAARQLIAYLESREEAGADTGHLLRAETAAVRTIRYGI